jgi:hypothetical protein
MKQMKPQPGREAVSHTKFFMEFLAYREVQPGKARRKGHEVYARQ